MTEGKPTERLKQAVSKNVGGICEYYRSRRDYSPDPFSVEHIHPRARGGVDTPENLALSCHGCNGHKHAKTEALDPVIREHVPLFHPRQQQWREHFESGDDFTLIIGLTPNVKHYRSVVGLLAE